MAAMILYPAIDILGGKVVRLLKGDYKQVSIYHDDPVAVAKHYEQQGAQWLHCVDLDGAKSNHANHTVIRELVSQVGIPVQLGGGIRTMEHVESWIKIGVSRIILGTAALQDFAFLARCCRAYPNRISLSADIRDGALWSHGWLEKVEIPPLDWIKQGAKVGATAVIVTDIDRDGTLKGPNWQMVNRIACATTIQVIVSGGIGRLSDIAELGSYPRIAGAIIGKALYDKVFTLSAALQETESGG